MTIPDEVDIIVCGGKQAISGAAINGNTNQAEKGVPPDALLQAG